MPTIKQYVNLPSGVTNIHGPTRDLKLQPNTIPNVSPGDRVEWWVDPVGANNTDQQYLSLAARAHLNQSETVISPSNFFENTLTLPHVGGDKYEVKASKKNDRSNSVATDTFETWRKLYYTVYHMGNAGLNFFNNLEADFKAAYERCFIEIENTAKTATLTEMLRVDVSYNRSRVHGLSFPFLDGSADAIADLAPEGSDTIQHKPYNLVFLILPDIFRITPRNNRAVFTTTVGTTTYNFRLHEYPGRPRAFLRSAQIRWPGQVWIDAKPYYTLVSAGARSSQINWDFSAVNGLTTHLARRRRNNFEVRWTVLKEHRINGFSWRNLCVVKTSHGMPGVLQTCVHEMGHGVDQVVKWEDRWDAAGASIAREHNPRWYDDVYGGRGSHCNTNAVLRAGGPPGLTSGQIYVHQAGAGSLCTMYHAGSRHKEPHGRFCASHCEPRVKRRNLDHPSRIAQRWDHFG